MTTTNPNVPDLRKAITGGVLAILVLVGLLLGTGAFYTVDAAQQAVVLQFGRPVGDPVTTPGLHFKMPFIQEVRFFDRRIQAWDGDPNQIPTRGREFISVDTTARWKIVDALKFLQSVRAERGALARLDDILDSVVRDMVSST
ncbi:MAG: SPFH domain-containing protein, partial [Planctomycetota bacterium]